MRTGRLLIDGNDALVNYGIAIAEGGFDGVVVWPRLKTPQYIEWPEEPGIEPDLLSVSLEPKDSIRVDFFCRTAPTGTDAFIAMLQSESYHVFNFKEIGVTMPLRYKSLVSRDKIVPLECFTLEFAFDFDFLDEMEPYVGTPAYLTFRRNGSRLVFNQNLLVFTDYDEGQESHAVISKKKTGLLLDGEDFGDFGCYVLEGSDNEITKAAPLKDNLIIKATGMKGQLYPDNTAVKGAKTVSIPLLMRAVNPSLFWKEYLRLLGVFASNGNRVLTWKGKTYKCYYQSQSLGEFVKLGDNQIWCQFTVTLCFYEGE